LDLFRISDLGFPQKRKRGGVMAQDKLIKTAVEYIERAYAPYSGFKVGAAVEGGSGKIYGGCNVENASYGLTICAERTAVTKAVSEGETSIKRVAVATSKKELSFPCGACRQVIIEFGENAEIICCDPEGNCDTYSARELLPYFDQGGTFRANLEELKT
jgi:cytidine deaminase